MKYWTRGPKQTGRENAKHRSCRIQQARRAAHTRELKDTWRGEIGSAVLPADGPTCATMKSLDPIVSLKSLRQGGRLRILQNRWKKGRELNIFTRSRCLTWESTPTSIFQRTSNNGGKGRRKLELACKHHIQECQQTFSQEREKLSKATGVQK